ncbi:hypothetical protein C8R44DRAFT_731862 [Mycena epipterygia]|nr:hypothetical protein C8R44DRAFT_731862 [Mycena epipterygia]
MYSSSSRPRAPSRTIHSFVLSLDHRPSAWMIVDPRPRYVKILLGEALNLSEDDAQPTNVSHPRMDRRDSGRARTQQSSSPRYLVAPASQANTCLMADTLDTHPNVSFPGMDRRESGRATTYQSLSPRCLVAPLSPGRTSWWLTFNTRMLRLPHLPLDAVPRRDRDTGWIDEGPAGADYQSPPDTSSPQHPDSADTCPVDGDDNDDGRVSAHHHHHHHYSKPARTTTRRPRSALDRGRLAFSHAAQDAGPGVDALRLEKRPAEQLVEWSWFRWKVESSWFRRRRYFRPHPDTPIPAHARTAHDAHKATHARKAPTPTTHHPISFIRASPPPAQAHVSHWRLYPHPQGNLTPTTHHADKALTPTGTQARSALHARTAIFTKFFCRKTPPPARRSSLAGPYTHTRKATPTTHHADNPTPARHSSPHGIHTRMAPRHPLPPLRSSLALIPTSARQPTPTTHHADKAPRPQGNRARNALPAPRRSSLIVVTFCLFVEERWTLGLEGLHSFKRFLVGQYLPNREARFETDGGSRPSRTEDHWILAQFHGQEIMLRKTTVGGNSTLEKLRKFRPWSYAILGNYTMKAPWSYVISLWAGNKAVIWLPNALSVDIFFHQRLKYIAGQ